MTDSLRILIANEPRAYREALGGMLRQVLFDAEVRMTGADRVEEAFQTFSPHLVICSTRMEQVLARAHAWILLYPDDADLAVVYLEAQQSIIPRVSVDDLLAVVQRIASQRAEISSASLRMAAEPEPTALD